MSNSAFIKYLESIPESRTEVTRKLREGLKKAVPKECEESIEGDMIRYLVPLSAYPKTYNKKPLLVAMIANKKSTLTVTLTGINNSPELKAELRSLIEKVDEKLAENTSCLKFKKVEAIPVDKIVKIQKKTFV